ncbi:MAG: radical SAM protein [Promethearchaeota archaeon]
MRFPKLTQAFDILTQHPCFNNAVHDKVGRIHLPVAPRCNIQCNFCERNICASLKMKHPGWTAQLLSVEEAVNLVNSIIPMRQNRNFVVGVAGPGDPLANEQTFETLSLIHKESPNLMKCISTNGLLLEYKLNDIINVGIKALTVTINAADSNIGKKIYSWVTYMKKIYQGEDAARLLIKKQFDGVKKAVDAGLVIKVNTVLIPGVNDSCMQKLAMKISEAGVKMMNIMPLIPSGKMKNYKAPSCEELKKIRQICEKIIPQFRRCEQCRADVIFLP